MRPRTIAHAIADGTAYRVHIPGWIEPYWPVGANTVQDALAYGLELGIVRALHTYTIDRVVGGHIGGFHVVACPAVTVGEI